MNVFSMECKMNLKTTLIWIVSLCCLGGVFMSFFPIIRNDLKTFLELMDNFPPAMKALMGMQTGLDFSSPLAYYTYALTFSVLIGAIQAMNLGIGIVSKETRDKTADFLMTKPISRTNILSAKLMASAVLLFVTALIYSAVMGIIVRAYAASDFNLGKYALISASFFFVQLIFLAIGIMVAVFSRKIRAVLPVSLGIVLFFYALSAFAVKSESDKIRFFTPFQYFKSDYIIRNGYFETAFLVTGLVLVIVFITASYVWFCRKDVHSV
jgi:ABC-2 type transport system permease protein